MVDKAGTSTRVGWPVAIAWLTTVVAPPVVAGGIWRQFVAGHVLVALAIWAVYEVAVGIVGFFAVVARDVSSRWQQRLADRQARIDDDEWRMLIDPDRLSAEFAKQTGRFPQELSVPEWEPLASWLRMTAKKLRYEAGNVFAREIAATPRVSTSIRLSALLLAGELNEMNRPRTWQYTGPTRSQPESPVANLFRDVAAGITWLERRHNGIDPATETIMLAIE